MTHGVSTGCGTIAADTPVRTRTLWFDPCGFTIQPQGFVGIEPRNYLRGPGLTNLDDSLVKDTKAGLLGEGGEVEFRAESLRYPESTEPLPTEHYGFLGLVP